MIIANPIYDVVFKYLLEDLDIARELLSTILGEEIITLEVKPQETSSENIESNLSILRFDFKALIKTITGEQKKILIELQKAKQAFDVMRFRRYLGDNYRKADDIVNEFGIMEKRPLPIVTIYFLGFPLDNIHNPVIKINREYRDAITEELIELKEDFVELLTHDTFLIQILSLKPITRNRLEKVLQIFNPEYQMADRHQLNFTGNVEDKLIEKMVSRLGRAIADENIRNVMDAEDDIERIVARELGKKDKIIAEKDVTIAEKDRTITQKDEELQMERDKIEALMRQIQDLQKKP